MLILAGLVERTLPMPTCLTAHGRPMRETRAPLKALSEMPEIP
jgi:hypothetical protein